MAQKSLWNLAKERQELPNEEGDVVGEHKVMHEEDFWSSWLREDEKSKEEKLRQKEKEKKKEGKEEKRRGKRRERNGVG